MPLILLTRPQKQSEAMVKALKVPCFIEPMLFINPVPSVISWEHYTDFIVTSAQVFDQDLPFPRLARYWCVGPQTAERARIIGLTNVQVGPGTGEKLAEHILKEQLHPSSFLYLRGRDITFSMVEKLQNHNLSIHETIVYESTPRTAVSTTLNHHLTQGNIIIAPFYSVKTAETFVQLLYNTPLASAVSLITAMALSEKIAQTLKFLPWKEIVINDTLANDVIEEYYELTLESAWRKP